MIKLFFYFLPFLSLFVPSMWVNYVLRKNNETLPDMPFTGNELGIKLLQENNLENVLIEPIKQIDHYNPIEKKVNISEDKLHKKSITSIAIVAHEIGFKHLYGVDISESFINICRTNLQTQSCNADLLISDISNYEPPSGRICIYMFNPFGEKKMKEFLAKINNRQDDTLIVYHNPKYSYLFNSDYLIKKFTWHNFGLYEEKCHIYLVSGKGNS